MAASAAFAFSSMAKALPHISNNNSSSSSISSRSLQCAGRRGSFLNGIRMPSHSASAAAPVRLPKSSRRPPLGTVMMAKREMELEELRKMSDDEIKASVVELKGELIVLRMKQVARQEIKTSEFQRMKKRIARMLTIHRERELEQGIKKRQSRKLDKEWKRNVVMKPPPSLLAAMEKKEES